MTAALASRHARTALANVVTEYPNKLEHLLNDATDAQTPAALHPLFYGSYDWHSSVHMHWLLARLLRLYPDLPEAPAMRERLDLHFSAANVAAECAYLQRPGSATFERTYGWAWLLKLAAELRQSGAPRAAAWAATLQPLADAFVERYLEFLPRADYPIRVGAHPNSAFGLLLALDYAEVARHTGLRELIDAKARQWYGHDTHYPARYEPGGDEFLSGGLIEAALMHRLLDAPAFAAWWAGFCPPGEELTHWRTPVRVADRGDAKMSHLDGLNLSRAWCWKQLRPSLPSALQGPVEAAIADHLAASLDQAASGHYVGTHWLATFATLALTVP